MFQFLQSLLNVASTLSQKIERDRLFDEARDYFDAKEYKTALPLMKESAELGSPHAMAHLGVMYMKGMGVPCDWKMASELLEMTIKIEDYQGTYFSTPVIKSNLGLIHGIGGYGLKRNGPKARQYLEEAISEGDEATSQVLPMLLAKKGPFGGKEQARPKIQW